MVFPDPPLPFGTAAARWYYVLLQGLQARGYTVVAYAACATAQLADEAMTLFPPSEYDLRCFLYPQRGGWCAKWETWREPYSYIFGPDLRLDLERTLAGGDCILHLETHWSGWLALSHLQRAVLNIHSLYGVDLASAPRGSWWNTLRTRRVFAAEKKLLRAYPRLTTLSQALADRLRQTATRADVRVVPFGFDSSLYAFTPSVREAGTRPVVGLIGSFNWQPTYTAGIRLLTRLWPDIRRRVPNAQLLIVGRQARSALASCLPVDDPDVTIEENVPDILPYFRKLDTLLYAPGQGTGVKVKVLEAFALGVPVVTNRDGVEGIPATHGRQVSLGESDEDLIASCVRLLIDRNAAIRQAREARTLLEEHCGPEHVLEGWRKIYAQIASGGMLATGKSTSGPCGLSGVEE